MSAEAESSPQTRNANLSFINAVKVIEAEKTSPTNARIVYKVPVLREYLNPSMTLHGGQQAAFYDIGTSWLLYLVRRPGFWTNAGTSRSLTVTYLRPAVQGDDVMMECEVSPLIFHFSQRLCSWNAESIAIKLTRGLGLGRQFGQAFVSAEGDDEEGEGRRADIDMRAYQVQCRCG